MSEVQTTITFIVGVFTIAGMLAAAVAGTVRIMRNYIRARVDTESADVVAKAVAEQLGPKLDLIEKNQLAISINQRETSAAVGRVSQLETRLSNGISERQDRIENKVDTITEILMVAHKWDGSERRIDGMGND